MKKLFSGKAVILVPTYINGKPVSAGTLVSCSAADFGLLTEANRAEEFDPENEAHAAIAAKLRAEVKDKKDAK